MRLLSALTRRYSSRPDSSPAPDREPARMLLPEPPEPILALPPPKAEPRPRHDLRRVSPRRFAEIAHELYLEGALKWAEYQQIAIPSELHPDYDSTIGALIGCKAEPDRPRDLLAEWEGRVDFMRRYRDPALRHAERAVEVLRRQAEPRL